MIKGNVLVILGGGINKDGTLPPHVFPRLDLAYNLYSTEEYEAIITSGRGAIVLERKMGIWEKQLRQKQWQNTLQKKE